MTHEQKPESAEFRTREAQVDEIHEATVKAVCRGRSDYTPEIYRTYLGMHILEAEARAAAEQRRKDAMECQVVGQWQRSDGAWEDCDPNDLPSYIISGKTKRILYSDPRYASILVADARTVVREHEQRRKDAEGAEPIVATYDMAWAAAQKHIELSYGPEATVRQDVIPHFIAIVDAALSVAPRPANVAALEHRVKELEDVVRGYLEASDLFDACTMICPPKALFEAKDTAMHHLRAAAIRGGEQP